MEHIDDLLRTVELLKNEILRLQSEYKSEYDEKRVENNDILERLKYFNTIYQKNRNSLLMPKVKDADSSTKDSYIKLLILLCLVNKRGLQIDQNFLLKRIIAGIDTDKNEEEYFSSAFNFTNEDLEAFCITIGQTKYKYYWFLDAVLLAAYDESLEVNVFLAEISILLELSKIEVIFLMRIAKIIVYQEDDQYDKYNARLTKKPDAIPGDIADCYLNAALVGTVDTSIDDMKVLKYHGKDYKNRKEIVLDNEYDFDKLIFENVKFNLDKHVAFNCHEIVFNNCEVCGDNFNFPFSSLRILRVEKSTFHDFSDGVFEFEKIEIMQVTESIFINCAKYGKTAIGAEENDFIHCPKEEDFDNDDPDEDDNRRAYEQLSYKPDIMNHIGGGKTGEGVIFNLFKADKLKYIRIEKNTFKNCISNRPTKGIIFDMPDNAGRDKTFNRIHILVKNNKFYACYGAQNSDYDQYHLFNFSQDVLSSGEIKGNNISDNNMDILKKIGEA